MGSQRLRAVELLCADVTNVLLRRSRLVSTCTVGALTREGLNAASSLLQQGREPRRSQLLLGDNCPLEHCDARGLAERGFPLPLAEPQQMARKATEPVDLVDGMAARQALAEPCDVG